MSQPEAIQERANRAAVWHGVAAGVWRFVEAEIAYRDNFRPRAFPVEQERDRALELIAALNSGDPEEVHLLRNHSGNPERDVDNEEVLRNIEAAMPPAGGRFALADVHDRGDQGRQKVLWHSEHRVHRFDFVVDQICPDKAATSRTIGVLAFPVSLQSWAEAAFVFDR
ncbi:hypothetical protein [Mycolicibacter minnesotensis]